MALHLRALNTPFGLVTNGERWMLVHAPTGQVATFASWYARIWGQEPATLRAFVSLLGVRRFFAPEQDRLPALFERSLKHQDEVTDALGDQVRRAIEVLVQLDQGEPGSFHGYNSTPAAAASGLPYLHWPPLCGAGQPRLYSSRILVPLHPDPVALP